MKFAELALCIKGNKSIPWDFCEMAHDADEMREAEGLVIDQHHAVEFGKNRVERLGFRGGRHVKKPSPIPPPLFIEVIDPADRPGVIIDMRAVKITRLHTIAADIMMREPAAGGLFEGGFKTALEAIGYRLGSLKWPRAAESCHVRLFGAGQIGIRG